MKKEDQFDPENNIVKLCAAGMEMEGAGNPKAALKLFEQAWNEATNDHEKFTAAHYVARQQQSVEEKLRWDEIALTLALKVGDDKMKAIFPSLHLNVGKCYEDLKDFTKAKEHYDLGMSFTSFLGNDGYGRMIKAGLENGLKRTAGATNYESN